MSEFSFQDRLRVPEALATAHAALPKQSVNVLNEACTEENQLIRLLLGTVKIKHESSGREVTQNVNYSVLGCPKVQSKGYHFIQNALAPYEIATGDLDVHLRKTVTQRKYYRELLSETCNYFFRTAKGEHTLAFLHLYRFLEHISFAFPMLYAARTSDFASAYAALKEYLAENDKKEVGFFRTFVSASIPLDLRRENTTIAFNDVPAAYRSNIFSAVRAQIKDEYINSAVLDSDIEFKNEGILELCINIRNRYFHFTASNRKNISSASIGDPDILFGLVNKPILNWLAVIYFETLRHKVNG